MELIDIPNIISTIIAQIIIGIFIKYRSNKLSRKKAIEEMRFKGRGCDILTKLP